MQEFQKEIEMITGNNLKQENRFPTWPKGGLIFFGGMFNFESSPSWKIFPTYPHANLKNTLNFGAQAGNLYFSRFFFDIFCFNIPEISAEITFSNRYVYSIQRLTYLHMCT